MTDDILFHEVAMPQGRAGVVVLNRPKALNAMSLAMFQALHAQLLRWAADDSVLLVLMESTHEKAFCAGGDVVWLFHQRAQGIDAGCEFFHVEYQVNHLLGHYPKPVIALLDGLTFGGGVGLSFYGSHQVVTERFRFAMPETTIGFFPDVGATYLLSRLDHGVGYYLGLLGETIDAATALDIGLIAHSLKHDDIAACKAALLALPLAQVGVADVDAVLGQFTPLLSAEAVGAAGLPLPHAPRLTTPPTSYDDYLAQLKAHLSAPQWASLQEKSSIALQVSYQAITQARDLSLRDCLQRDYQLGITFLQSHDFYEGINARLVAKHQQPAWQLGFDERLDAAEMAVFFQFKRALFA